MINYPSDIWCGIKCIRDNETCIFGTTGSCQIIRTITKAFHRRVQYHKYQYERHNGVKQTPNINDYTSVFSTSLQGGFVCKYCGKKMKFLQPGQRRHLKDMWTIDYITSIQNGGTHDRNNLVICCHECNGTKGGYENRGSGQLKRANLNSNRKRIIYGIVKSQEESCPSQ